MLFKQKSKNIQINKTKESIAITPFPINPSNIARKIEKNTKNTIIIKLNIFKKLISITKILNANIIRS